jgi:D-aminoacyl-tRNA deacylase
MYMRAVIQRVTEGSVTVEGEVIGKIGHGLLVLLAIHVGDTDDMIEKMAGKIARLRVFEDEEGKMSRSVQDTNGAVLVISQFTLYGDVRKGNRPGFTDSARPEKAEPMYESVVKAIELSGLRVQTGRFASDMKVALVNDGPVTIIIDL